MDIRQISPTRTTLATSELSVMKYSAFDLKPFDNRIIEFSNRLSKRILTHPAYSRIPALTALGYWLRKTNIKRIVDENKQLGSQPNVVLSPIGIVFHVCPANDDTMFVYSLMISLLMGNKNILRISNRLDHEYINFLFDVINQELAEPDSLLISKYININPFLNKLIQISNVKLLNFGYQIIANNRMKLTNNNCKIPPKEILNKFILS